MASRSRKEEEPGKKIVLLSVIIIILDQITKYIFTNKNIAVINNIFHVTYVENTGSVFGILQNTNTLLIFLSLIVFGAVVYYYEKLPWILTSLLIGGLVGNLIDRIRLGFVVDFLDFRIWPVFNIADSCITITVIGLIVYFWKK